MEVKFRAKVMHYAHVIFNATKCTFSMALKKAWSLYKLAKQMSKGVVKFCYEKVNGTARIAYGTLANLHYTASTKAKKPSYLTMCYFDTEKNAFRSFKVENFIGIMNF